MRFFALPDARTLRLATACAALLASTSTLSFAQDDPPDQAGRISWASGTVSVQPMGSEDWGQAYVNLPMGPGDRVFTDSDGWAEIQVGQTYMRMGPNTDVTLVSDTPSSIGFGVAQGSVHLHTFGLWQDQWLNVSTPNGNAQFAEIGELRVDVLPADGATVFTNFGQGAYLTGAGGYEQQVGNMQSIELAGTNPVYPQWLQPSSPDRLDAWSQQRDQWATQAASYRYVSPEVPGAADLDANGDWVPDSDYGPMWFPRNDSEDWEPYHNGHWVNRDPWGWVWVEDEPWGLELGLHVGLGRVSLWPLGFVPGTLGMDSRTSGGASGVVSGPGGLRWGYSCWRDRCVSVVSAGSRGALPALVSLQPPQHRPRKHLQYPRKPCGPRTEHVCESRQRDQRDEHYLLESHQWRNRDAQ